ncbi:MAG: putative membrane protein YeiB [Oceanicoccus sp.]|jgi:uncharacterized membrane protein YeiB
MMEISASDHSVPVSKKERTQSIDTLLGIALFGIFLLNIIVFALPTGA